MQFLTDDGGFGFLVTPLGGRNMFRFQLIIAGQVVGDSEPCILGSAMKRLGSLARLDDERLSLLSSEPATVVSILCSEEDLHDAAILSLAESLDHWMICGYMYQGSAVMLAQEYRASQVGNPLLISHIDAAEYGSIFDATRSYWSKVNDRGR